METDNSGSFKSHKIASSIPFSSLVLLNSEASATFSFISNKSKQVGIVQLINDSCFKVIQTYKLTTLPSEMISADTDKDGFKEVLLFGPNFNGLLILNHSKSGWAKKSIEQKYYFSSGTVSDVNSDGYSDFVATDLKSGGLYFYYNNSRGDFKLEKTLQINGAIDKISAKDINNDGYDDISYVSGTSFEILLGDSVHSFAAKKSFLLPSKIESYFFGDFNDDKKVDIAYQEDNGGVSILFQKQDAVFYSAVPYLPGKTTNMLNSYIKSGFANLAVLSGQHSLLTINRFENLSNTNNFAFYTNHKSSFVSSKNKGDRIECAIIDGENSTLHFYQSQHGLVKYYVIPLFGSYEEGLYETVKENTVEFYLSGSKLQTIQALSLDLKSAKYDRKFIPFAGKLLDYDIVYQSINDRQLGVLALSNSKVTYDLYVKSNNGYKSTASSSNLFNFTNGKILSTKTVMFTTETKDEYLMHLWNLQEKSTNIAYKNSLKSSVMIGTFAGDYVWDKKNHITTFFKKDNSYYCRFTGGNDKTLKIEKSNDFNQQTELSVLKSYRSHIDEFPLFNSKDNKLFTADFNGTSSASFCLIDGTLNAESAIIKKIGKENFVFIISQQKEGVVAKKIH